MDTETTVSPLSLLTKISESRYLPSTGGSRMPDGLPENIVLSPCGASRVAHTIGHIVGSGNEQQAEGFLNTLRFISSHSPIDTGADTFPSSQIKLFDDGGFGGLAFSRYQLCQDDDAMNISNMVYTYGSDHNADVSWLRWEDHRQAIPSYWGYKYAYNGAIINRGDTWSSHT